MDPDPQNQAAAELHREAREIRRMVLETLHRTGGGHFGGSLSVVDILLALYRHALRVFPSRPEDLRRDRFILSKGHAAVALYAVLARLGFFAPEWLATYGQAGSPLQGHPDMTALAGIDFSTGSLGQGVAAGLGMALALRGQGPRVWVVVGDGECQEGQVWEAALLASRYRLDNLHVVVDVNGYQEFGWRGAGYIEPDPVPRISAKWRAFDWAVFEAEGHDYPQLLSAYARCRDVAGRPSVVVARTVKGAGFPMLERDPQRFHCAELDESEYGTILAAERTA
jgi:transketolase